MHPSESALTPFFGDLECLGGSLLLQGVGRAQGWDCPFLSWRLVEEVSLTRALWPAPQAACVMLSPRIPGREDLQRPPGDGALSGF